jgi:nucleoside-diphosphate-sugar epimerase
MRERKMLKEAKVLVAGGTGVINVNLSHRLLLLDSKVGATFNKHPL